jgi:hypothetical protein
MRGLLGPGRVCVMRRRPAARPPLELIQFARDSAYLVGAEGVIFLGRLAVAVIFARLW